MIGKFLSKVFRGFHAGRSVSTAKKMIRRIAIEPLESRRLLAVTGSLSGYAYLDTHDFGVKDADEAGYAGLTVQLEGVDSQGNLSSVAGIGPVQTLSDGSYSFTGLAAGTYQVQILPASTVDVGILSPGLGGRHRRQRRDPDDARRRPERHGLQFRDPRRTRQRPQRADDGCGCQPADELGGHGRGPQRIYDHGRSNPRLAPAKPLPLALSLPAPRRARPTTTRSPAPAAARP